MLLRRQPSEMVVKRSADAAAAVLSSKEEDFPRGGGGALTALERRQAREEGRSRAERELSQGPRPSKKRKPSRDVEVGPSLSLRNTDNSLNAALMCSSEASSRG